MNIKIYVRYPMNKSCTIFVGNIEYDIPESKIIDELSVVGKVVSFKLVIDRVTGKSKGYGFCEYESPLIAETAIQTLKLEFNGRPVAINYVDTENTVKAKKEMELNSIVKILENMDKSNMKEVIFYIKKMAVDEPSKLKYILKNNVELTAAILQALTLLNIIKPKQLKDMLRNSLSVEHNKIQIIERIKNMDETEIEQENIKEKISELKKLLQNDEN
ncbi:Cleavage stimulation factor [Spraguea lophii 42_110]|uniref:Cleavage stimulation factor n=1 Tax=Spraguea lophii (strain 42_110) TaxID=1358809 RepID=S7W859_SPRLO|nr:Cleavage stimulation factor [Spraguea lophii 42_110]